MKTVNIKGKEYVMVNERIKEFRKNFAEYALLSEIIELTNERVVIKATIKNIDGIEIANGIACEMQNSSFVNKTSYIEVCETSAWGRALGNMGIGIDASIASYEEVKTTIENQKDFTDMKNEISGLMLDLAGKIKPKEVKSLEDVLKGNDEIRIKRALMYLQELKNENK